MRRWRVKAIFRRPPIPKARSRLGHRRHQGEVTRSRNATGGDGERRVHVRQRGGWVRKSGSQLKGKSLAPVTPPARAVSGEIPKNPPPTAPTGGPQPKTGAATGAPPAPKTEPVTTASKGIPVEAIHTSAIGSAKGRATEFGAQAVLAAQLGSVRGAEAAKAAAALENLAPEIEKAAPRG